MKTQAFFQNIRSQLIKEIDASATEIFVAVAWFTDKKIFEALLSKASSGVTVELIIVDDEINQTYGPDFSLLEELNGKVVKVAGSNDVSLMHNKFCVIDRKTVITGSYNWSKKASVNHENITITWEHPILAEQFINEFNSLKKRYTTFTPLGQSDFDYGKIAPRLQIIKSLILVNEFQELELHIDKLKQFQLSTDVEQIIVFIRQFFYSDAIIAIEKLAHQYSTVISMDADKIASLKLSIIYLEIELSSLQIERDSIDKLISEFRHKVRVQLGALILKLLDLKIEWNKIREKLGKTFEYEQLKKDFNSFEEEINVAKENPKVDLSKEKLAELKELYRRGVQLCHPDKVEDKYKSLAQEIFIRLKTAMDENNLEEVRRIVESLECGVWDLGPDPLSTNELRKLEKLQQELQVKISGLKRQLSAISATEDYLQLKQYDSVESYIAAQEIILKQEISVLEHKIKNLANEQ